MEYLYITNDVEIAKICDENNVIPWIDLEILGKEERQKGMNTVKSKHCIQDITLTKKVLKNMPLLVRINPMNENSEGEINKVIELGADIIMLPMFKNKDEVSKFLEFVNRRCKTMLLFETKQSVENIDDILSLDGIDGVHIGLNDLHLSFRLDFMFEPVVNGIVDYMCQKFRDKKIPYGFGGIARLGEGSIPAEFIILEHRRLESSRVILSRSFCNIENYNSLGEFEKDFKKELRKITSFEKGIYSLGKQFILENHILTKKIINDFVKKNFNR